MKKILLLFLSLFIFTSFIYVQEIIENPKKPFSENPGRILTLEKVMKIKENKDPVFFEGEYYQLGIDIAHDGSVFVKDKLKLYRFDANGKFVKNILKIGQGPGEIQRELTDYKVIGDDVILFSGSVSKLVKLDLSGNLKEELKLIQRRFSRFLAFYNQKYFFIDYRRTDFSRKSGMKEYERNLCIQDQEGYINVAPFSFPTKSLVSYLSGGVSIVPVTQPIVSRIAEHYIYLSHTQEYLINQIDLNSGKVSKVFRRTYPRVKCPRKRRRDLAMLPKGYLAVFRIVGPKKFEIDIYGSDGKLVYILKLPEGITLERAKFYDFGFAIKETREDGFEVYAEYEIKNLPDIFKN
jgi:hypothetical protein